MCGITGFYSVKKNFDRLVLEEMTRCLKHRGPDAEGFYYTPHIGLGHRRLSIIDVSENGNQPMYSHNKKYVMVYNGEVYNYKEIGEKLSRTFGYKFNSSSDSEIILEAFSRWGVGFVEKLNGMFAVAIYDLEERTLFVFRDRIGIKPIYYYWDGETFFFASELKALLKVKDVPRKIDKVSVRHFLQLGFIPAPLSIYEDIRKVKAGSYIKLSPSGFEENSYWDPSQKFTKEILNDEHQAKIKLNDLLKNSVALQLRSDVPYGVFLSGGIDSSLVTAIATTVSPTKINTFSIGFKESRFDESPYAKSVASHLGTVHHELMVSYENALELINEIQHTYDEPFADSSAIPTMLVSKLARQHVKVALSGEGSDELFFGYGAHKWSERLSNPLLKLFHTPLSILLNQFPKSRYKRLAALLDYGSSENINAHIFSQEQYLFSKKEVEGLLKEVLEEPFLSAGKPNRKLSPMEGQALFDLQYYLQDDLLTKIDRASMKFSLETRVPFLDHHVVEFALNLAPQLKFKNGVSKYIVKEILYQYVPKQLFDRPKQGFSIPLEKWLKNELKYLVDDFLNEKIVKQYDLVDYKLIEELKNKFYSGDQYAYLYNRLWVQIMLHQWLVQNHPSS